MGKRGPKARSAEERASRYLRVRVRPDELEVLQSAADRAGLSVSAWVRATLLRAAKRQTRARGGRA